MDVAYNPLANALHAPWKVAAIPASKPVLTDEAVRPQSCRGAKHPRRCGRCRRHRDGGFPLLVSPVTQRILGLAAGDALGELRHVEVRMAMPAPDPDDPRWSLELAGGALMDLGCYGLHAIYVMSRQTAIRPQVCAAHASQRFPGVDEWYDVGVFHRRRQCRHHPRVRAGGHPYRVFIAHDLDEDNRTLLRARKISAVLHHDLRADANLAGRLINQTYGGMRGVATAMSSIRVVTPFNML